MIQDMSIQQFLDALASKSSTPGGGSAAAIMGAMGAALVSMVCNLTIGKKNYEAVSAEHEAMLEQSEKLRRRVMGMVKADIEVFEQVMAAYGMPKDTEAQREARAEAIQTALKAATDVPLECARACAEIVRLCRPLAEKGNKNVVSDAGVAVLAAYAALRSAALNVYINIGGIKDEAFVKDRERQLNEVLSGLDNLTEEVYRIVRERL